ncbi:MAG: DUF3422 domain-containing protein [Paracoccus sp. (in: a-proteobacteria)]|nr:DUF3422 domain-containing protein [Paracoccus sp. (in: a-proteobacteria)]
MNRDHDHPLRSDLVNELHARPSPRVSAPATAVMLAFKEPQAAHARDRTRDVAHLAALARRQGAVAPAPAITHYAEQMGRHRLIWESHTEFVTYTAISEGAPARPFDAVSGAIFADDWQAAAPGKRVTAVMVELLEMPADERAILPQLERWFSRDSVAAVQVLEQSAVVASDFRIDPAGWMRIAVFVRPEVGPGRTGRLLQRLLELETYRAMSMLGLGRARDLGAHLNRLDPELTGLVAGMQDGPADATLDRLLAVSQRLESLAMGNAFRYGATRAYEAIVHDRIAALREERFENRQLLAEFMTRRYDPAMRTVQSAQDRVNAMIDRAGRAGELLRTRVDVERSAQNQSLMERMDRRADLQLRLQHTVEGLSVVAISYYAVGLLSYMLAPLAARAGIDKAVAIALATPVAVALVWLGLRRIKARLHKPDGPHL